VEHRYRVRPIKFFRQRLLRLTTGEQIAALVAEYRHERKQLRDHIVSLMWHMRGSLSREEAWTLSPDERTDIQEFIEERIKLVEKTKMPLI
jgi:uncharacterized coiled-coil DUF342 family protein